MIKTYYTPICLFGFCRIWEKRLRWAVTAPPAVLPAWCLSRSKVALPWGLTAAVDLAKVFSYM